MKQNNPPHPAEFIFRVYMGPLNLSNAGLAEKLGVSVENVQQLLQMQIKIDEEWAIRLSKAFGRSPESWLLMQQHYDSFNRS